MTRANSVARSAAPKRAGGLWKFMWKAFPVWPYRPFLAHTMGGLADRSRFQCVRELDVNMSWPQSRIMFLRAKSLHEKANLRLCQGTKLRVAAH
jgi:hypothetical protein